MKAACVFPGQGSQKLGMGKDLFDKFPELVKLADEVLGYSITELCLEDKLKVLSNTRYTQPALFVINAMSYLDYISMNPAPGYVAGHSLGEYNALVASGIITFEEGLKLVSIRGRLMSEAVDGAMAAVIGMTRKQLEDVLKRQFLEIEIANYNSYLQNVISGPKDIIDKSENTFKNLNARFIKLNVSGAFHSRYMESAKKNFDVALSKTNFKTPQITVLSNYSALPYNITDIKENLSMQLISPVKWLDIMELLLKEADQVIQIGPGRVLNGLTKCIMKGQ